MTILGTWVACVIPLAVACGDGRSGGVATPDDTTSSARVTGEEEGTMGFELTSDAFDDGGTIPTKHTCEGDDVSPPLAWSDPPEGTESFALIVDDPDAPNQTWDHWILYDLPEHARELPEDVGPAQRLEQLGEAAQGRNDFGDVEWGGPCPPPGDEPHRYSFRLHALDATLGLDPGVAKPALEDAMEGHVLATAELTGRFGR